MIIANGHNIVALELAERCAYVQQMDVRATSCVGEAVDLAQWAARTGSDVIAAGGDGTVRHIAGALRGSESALGILPAGRANVVAFNCGVTRLSVAQQCQVARHGSTRPHRLGLLRVEREEPFLAVAGIGYDAQAIATAPTAGWWGYYWAGVRQIWRRGTTAQVVAGEQMWCGQAWSVLLARMRAVPPGIEIAGEADLTAAVIAPAGWWQWPLIAANRLLRWGSQPWYAIRSHDTVQVRMVRPMPVHADGCAVGRVSELTASVADCVLLRCP